MDKDKFTEGDIVQLKSGGPIMTVHRWENIRKNFYCQWFIGNKLEGGEFKAGELKKVEKHENK